MLNCSMTVTLKGLDSPERIAEAGEKAYADRYKSLLESTNRGHFVAIDVLTGEAYVAEFPEQALEKARAQAPNGVFHLIRIGAPGAFKVSFGSSRNAFWGRPLRQPR
jgi:hypothetical protein